MKKLYSLLFLAMSAFALAQPFNGIYTFDGVTTTSGATDPSALPSVNGVFFNSFTAVNTNSTPTNSTAGTRFSFTNQPTGATNGDDNYANLTGSVDTGVYYEVTVGPNPGGQIDLSTITFVGRRSGTGVRTFVVRSSLDGYTTNLPASVGGSTLVSVQSDNVFFVILDATTSNLPGMVINLGPVFENLTSNVTFRFYGYNAEGSGGTFSIDTVDFAGNIDVLSTDNFSNIEGLKMYPNPAKDNLFIETALNGKINVTIYDSVGKKVIDSKEIFNNQINISNLSSGVYIVNITEENKTTTRKLILE